MPSIAFANALKMLFQREVFPKGEIFIVKGESPGRPRLHPWSAQCVTVMVERLDDIAMLKQRYEEIEPSPFCREEILHLTYEAALDGIRIKENILNDPSDWLEILPNSEPLYAQWKAYESLIDGGDANSLGTVDTPQGAAPGWEIFWLEPQGGIAIQVPYDNDVPARIITTEATLPILAEAVVAIIQSGSNTTRHIWE